MSGGKYDSSKTRVKPVFDLLWARGRNWLPELLSLPGQGCPGCEIKPGDDLTLLEGYWEPHEKGLNPPVALLSWLIRNPDQLRKVTTDEPSRQLLMKGDPATVESALDRLRTEGAARSWHLFEGLTYPDVYLVSRDALVVIEGKRTESGATTDTTWFSGRHQIWRHIDAVWEIRGRRSVYGFFVVEGDALDGSVPKTWQIEAQACVEPNVLLRNFPHRSSEEARAISRCYLGVTTWHRVCEQLGIDWRLLPHEVPANRNRLSFRR